jgi:K+-transporting ATPase KdpF subunit
MKKATISYFGLLAVDPGKVSATLSNGTTGYIIGGIIGLLILGYLIYTLIRPEKF